MRLSDLMGLRVIDENGDDLGKVEDVRLEESGPVVPMTGRSNWALSGLIVGGLGAAHRLGYMHGDVRGPALLRAVMRRIGRKGHFVPWDRIAEFGEDRIRIRGTGEDLDHPYLERDGQR